jgi:hypothetical protein
VNPKLNGKLHNELFSYTNKNWKENPCIRTRSSTANDVVELSNQEAGLFYDFTSNLTGNNIIDTSSLTWNNVYTTALGTNQNYYDAYVQAYPNDSSDAYTMSPILYEIGKQRILSDLNTKTLPNGQSVVSTKEKAFLVTMINQIGVVESSRDYASYPAKLAQFEAQYVTESFNESNGEGAMAAIFIEIANNSHDYWTITYPTENPTFGRSERTQAWPLWLGLDALGALAGGIGSLASGGSLGQAGTQALIWGAAGSVPGTRWFRNLFR